jgi:hypothetical protein
MAVCPVLLAGVVGFSIAEVKVRNPHYLAATLKTHWNATASRNRDPPPILRRAFFVFDPVKYRYCISESSTPSSPLKSKSQTNPRTSPDSPGAHHRRYHSTVLGLRKAQSPPCTFT